MITNFKLPKEETWYRLVPKKTSILSLKDWHPLVPEKDSSATLDDWHELIPVPDSFSTSPIGEDSADDKPEQTEHRHRFEIDKLYLELDKRETINIEQDDEIFQLKRRLKRFEAENYNLKSEQCSLREEQHLLFMLKSCYRTIITPPAETIDNRHREYSGGEKEKPKSNVYHKKLDKEVHNAGHFTTSLPDYSCNKENIDQLYLEIDKRETRNIEQEDELFQLKRQLKRLQSENNYLKEEYY